MRIWLAVLSAVALTTCGPITPPPSVTATATTQTAEQLVARGQYLVTSLGGCNDCHTPHLPTGDLDMARTLQGAPLGFALVPALEGKMPWAAIAPPIAGGPAGYTDDQFAHFLMSGERPDHSQARPPMPQFRLNEDDARAVVAYMKTLPKAQ